MRSTAHAMAVPASTFRERVMFIRAVYPSRSTGLKISTIPCMEFQIRGKLIHWRGPSPFHFVPIPTKESAKIRSMAPQLTYGWGVIPVTVTIGSTSFSTSLFPKDGVYLVPIKNAVRTAQELSLGAPVTARLRFKLRG